MYHHFKKLFYPVRIGTPHAGFSNFLLEQFRGRLRARFGDDRFLNCGDDSRTSDGLQFLVTREITPSNALMARPGCHANPPGYRWIDDEIRGHPGPSISPDAVKASGLLAELFSALPEGTPFVPKNFWQDRPEQFFTKPFP